MPSRLSPLFHADDSADVVQSSLAFVRQHLGMEIAYLSEFVDNEIVFRAVDAPGFEDLVKVGKTMSLDLTYCHKIKSGKLPELIPDTDLEPVAQAIPVTQGVPIKSHISVPIYRRDGSTYGMFCCLSRSKSTTLNDRDLEMLRAFADLSSEQINDRLTMELAERDLLERIDGLREHEDYTVALQPIMDLNAATPVGYEALARFAGKPYRPPNLWFEDALKVGLQADLEIALIEHALSHLKDLPEHLYLSVNASPATVETGRLLKVITALPADRIVLEITEHEDTENPECLHEELMALRFRGMKLAVDDAGAGHSGLQQIVRLKPDIIKLDRSLTTGIDKDVVLRSLAGALVSFSQETNAKLVAEGIETEEELRVLKQLGVPLGQGFLLGKPKLARDVLAKYQNVGELRA